MKLNFDSFFGGEHKSFSPNALLGRIQGALPPEMRDIAHRLRAVVADADRDFREIERLFLGPLPILQRISILTQLMTDIPRWQEKLSTAQESPHVSAEALSKPQWLALATTPPVVFSYPSLAEAQFKIDELKAQNIQYELITTLASQQVTIQIPTMRLSFAFFKRPCAYKTASNFSKHRGGCTHCALSIKNRSLDSVVASHQMDALELALHKFQSPRDHAPLHVLEIIPCGSFFNDDEVKLQVQQGMLSRAGQVFAIQKVVVDSRIEYLSLEKIQSSLKSLRPNQNLEINMGLETTNAFVGDHILKKGYGFKEFKHKIRELIQGLSPEERRRVSFTVYSFMKPPYIGEHQAIQLAVEMARDIDAFSHEVGMPIEVKYEPGVISKETLQDHLYHDKDLKTGERRYEPLSYISVAELIAQLYEKKLYRHVKFGGRDDIDIYSDVPKVPHLSDSRKFSPLDFIVYNAVHRFNTGRNIQRFFADMRGVIEDSQEFRLWELKVYGGRGRSALSRLLKSEFKNSCSDFEKTAAQKEQSRITQVLEILQNGVDLEANSVDGIDEKQSSLEEHLRDLCEQRGIRFDRLKCLQLLTVEGGLENYQIEFTVFDAEGWVQNVWSHVPCRLLERAI